MENVIHNVLLARGFSVDVDVAEHAECNAASKVRRKHLEVDFACNSGNRRHYVQSAFSIPDREKMHHEQESLVRIGDSFKKIIVVKDRSKLWRNERGIVVMDIMNFLLDQNSLDR